MDKLKLTQEQLEAARQAGAHFLEAQKSLFEAIAGFTAQRNPGIVEEYQRLSAVNITTVPMNELKAHLSRIGHLRRGILENPEVPESLAKAHTRAEVGWQLLQDGWHTELEQPQAERGSGNGR